MVNRQRLGAWTVPHCGNHLENSVHGNREEKNTCHGYSFLKVRGWGVGKALAITWCQVWWEESLQALVTFPALDHHFPGWAWSPAFRWGTCWAVTCHTYTDPKRWAFVHLRLWPNLATPVTYIRRCLKLENCTQNQAIFFPMDPWNSADMPISPCVHGLFSAQKCSCIKTLHIIITCEHLYLYSIIYVYTCLMYRVFMQISCIFLL